MFGLIDCIFPGCVRCLYIFIYLLEHFHLIFIITYHTTGVETALEKWKGGGGAKSWSNKIINLYIMRA